MICFSSYEYCFFYLLKLMVSDIFMYIYIKIFAMFEILNNISKFTRKLLTNFVKTIKSGVYLSTIKINLSTLVLNHFEYF